MSQLRALLYIILSIYEFSISDLPEIDQQKPGRNDGDERRRIPPPVYKNSKPSKNGRRTSKYNHQHQKNYQNYQNTLFYFQNHSQFSESIYQCYRVLNYDVRGNRYGYSCYYSFFSSSAAQINRLTNFIFNLSDLVLRTSAMPSNLPIQLTKPSPTYSFNNRSQSRPLNSLNPNPVDSKYISNSEKNVYKPISKPKLQYKTEPERTSPVLIMQNLIYNPYVFKAIIPLPHTSKTPLFTGTNVTDFFKQFKNIAINYELSDNHKVRHVQKYYKFGIIQRI